MNIPEEIVNIIMEYAAQLNDSKWKIVFENNKLKFKINKFYSKFRQLNNVNQHKTVYYHRPCKITRQFDFVQYVGNSICVNRRLLPYQGPISWQSRYYIDYVMNGEHFYIWLNCRETNNRRAYTLMNDIYSHTRNMVYTVPCISKYGNNIILH